MKLIPLILIAVLLGACAGDPGIQTEFNPTVDFTQFRSFSFDEPNVQAQEGSVGRDPRVLETIFETIRKDLSVRSMQPVESGADLSIAISIAVGEEAGVAGAGYAWDSSGGQAVETPYFFKEGTLVIDFFDASSDQLVWRAWIHSAVNRTGDPDLEALEKMVLKMLQEYPPDPSKD
jgi:hypothetical protein